MSDSVSDRRHPRVINLSEVPLADHRHGDRYEARFGALARHTGARKLGYRLVILPPGKRAWPRHAHHVNEELFVILSGRGTALIGEDRVPIREGDVVAAPPDPAEPHQIVNDSNSDLRYLAVSTMEEPDVIAYPDSHKIGVLAGAAPGGDKNKRTVSWFGHRDAGLDYWEGED